MSTQGTQRTQASTGVQRIADAFANAHGSAALMPYLMAGYPTLERVGGDR